MYKCNYFGFLASGGGVLDDLNLEQREAYEDGQTDRDRCIRWIEKIGRMWLVAFLGKSSLGSFDALGIVLRQSHQCPRHVQTAAEALHNDTN